MRRDDDTTLLRLDTLGKLETLINLDTEHVDVNCLSKLGNLQRFKAVFNDIKDVSAILHSPSVVKSQLQHSDLSFNCLLTLTEETQTLLRCDHLRKLHFRGRIPELPRWNEFPHAIIYLQLVETYLEEDPMPTLEKLAQLRSLKLGKSSFVGNEMVCSCASDASQVPEISSSSTTKGAGCGFPRLVRTSLYNLPNLEHWKVEKGAMPNLQFLTISSCEKLKQVPEGIRYITTLMELSVVGMGEEFKNMLKEGERDYYKVQHIPQVQL